MFRISDGTPLIKLKWQIPSRKIGFILFPVDNSWQSMVFPTVLHGRITAHRQIRKGLPGVCPNYLRDSQHSVSIYIQHMYPGHFLFSLDDCQHQPGLLFFSAQSYRTTMNDIEAVKLRKKYTHFRILVIGRANAGKTTLLKRVCNTDEDPCIYDENNKNQVRCQYSSQFPWSYLLIHKQIKPA